MRTCQWRPEERGGSSGAGLIGSAEPLDTGAGN